MLMRASKKRRKPIPRWYKAQGFSDHSQQKKKLSTEQHSMYLFENYILLLIWCIDFSNLHLFELSIQVDFRHLDVELHCVRNPTKDFYF